MAMNIKSQEDFRKRMKSDSNEVKNPCFKESQISQKCLEKNLYDKDKCELEFENYKRCKKFWSYIKKDRASKGLPENMTEEEKQKVKNEFFRDLEEKTKQANKIREDYQSRFGKKS